MRHVLLIVLGLSVWSAAQATHTKPFVVPELKEWRPAEGFFAPTSNPVVRYDSPALRQTAEQFAADYTTLLGRRMRVGTGRPAPGDFLLSLSPDKELDKEGYAIDINRYVHVKAPTPQGVYWATRTLLQLSEQRSDRCLPRGTVKDWPDYAVRGLVLDCGRKFIPMPYLRNLAKIMAYYKMNVLHVVLNNNGFHKYFNNDWTRTYSA